MTYTSASRAYSKHSQPFRKQPLGCSMFTNHSLMVQADALVSLRCFTVFQKNLVLQMCNYGRCLPWLPSFVGYLPIDRPDYGNIRSSRQMCPLI